MDWYGSKSCNLFRVARAKFLAQTLEIEDVTSEGDGRVFVNKVTVQDAQKTTQLDLLPGFFIDFPKEGFLDRLSAFDAARGQSVNGLFVAVLRVQQDFAAELANGENYLPPAVRVFLPTVGAHIGVGFDVIASAERLPVPLRERLDFRLVYSRRYSYLCGHGGTI